MNVLKKICFLFSLMLTFTAFGQEEIRKEYKTRILFVIDASGSMSESWKGERKWDMAIHTISKLIDSFQIKNKNIELGIRLLGHQYTRNENRCDDSKLEIPFSNQLNETSVLQKLKKWNPKGQTPLAYSLAQTEFDFKSEENIQNLVVLITDGIETCNGNPCEISKKLKEKNIYISPYIIGLGIDSLKAENLQCIGKYIDVKDKNVFKTVIKTILADISKKTTLEIQFFDSLDQAISYYIPFSLIDINSGKDYYNYIYSKKIAKGVDTLFINPQFNYNFKIHTNPPILVDTFKLTMGTHNIFKFKLNSGTVNLMNIDKNYTNNYLIVDTNYSILTSIESNLKYRHLANNMLNIDVLTHPEYRLNSISIYENSSKEFELKNRSILVFKINKDIEASIFDTQWNLVYSIPTHQLEQSLELISNDYFLVYKQKNDHSEKSITLPITLKPQQRYEYLLK